MLAPVKSEKAKFAYSKQASITEELISLAQLKSQLTALDAPKQALVKFALLKLALFKLASNRSACTITALSRVASDMFAAYKSAWLRFEALKSAPHSLELESLDLLKSHLAKSPPDMSASFRSIPISH